MRLAPLRKMLACFVALCMVVASVPLMPQHALAESPTVSGGDTYPEEFIVGGGILSEVPEGWTGIYTAEDLSKVGWGGKYILMADIDLSDWGSWTPVGNFAEFDGNGHVVRNMTIDTRLDQQVASAQVVGLFSIVSWLRSDGYPSIRNLGIEDASIYLGEGSAASYVGVLAGSLGEYDSAFSVGSVQNCWVTGAITSESDNLLGAGGISGYLSVCNGESNCAHELWGDVDIAVNAGQVGGLFGCSAGSAGSSFIKKSANYGDVSTDDGSAGGIVGRLEGSTGYHMDLKECVNAGDVSATFFAAGMVGYTHTIYARLADCFNAGDISVACEGSQSRAAGILADTPNGTWTYLYNVGNVLATGESELTRVAPGYIDGSRGWTFNGKCYYLDSIDLVGKKETPYETYSLSDEQMRQQESFEGFDFENTWRMDSGDYGYPVLQWMTDFLIGKMPGSGGSSEPSKPQQTTATVFFSSELDVDEADSETGEKWVNRNVQVLWGDSLFAQPANAGYNHALARLGAALSCMTYAEGRYVNAADDGVRTSVEGGITQKVTYAAGVDPVADGSYAYKTLWGGSEGEGMGFAFDDIENRYYRDSQRVDDNDTCAYTLAVKEVERDGQKVPLVMVLVRGTAANAEWISNANLADTVKALDDCHEGFQLASTEVLTGVRDFLSARNYDADDVLFFVTGHSRGAAVANLVAAGLSTWQDGTEGVYAYTFAAPNCVSEDEAEGTQFDNIFNIANPDDIVTMIPLTGWGYTTYGETLYLPSKTNTAGYLQSDALAGVSTWFRELTNGVEYEPNPEGALGVSILVGLVRSLCWDVEGFYEPSFVFFAEGDAMSASLGDVVDSLMRLLYVKSAYTMEDAALLSAALVEKALPLSAILVGLAGLSGLGAMAALAALGASAGVLAWTTFSHAFHAHTPETYLAWMMEMGSGSSYKDRYKRVRVKCPVDMYAYDAAGNLVARIEGDAVDEAVLASGIPAYVDEDGAKYLDVPSDGAYSVKIVATGEGEMDYTVSECDGGGEVQRCAAFLDIPLEEGQEFDGDLPEGEAEQATEYALRTSNGQGGQDSVPLTGDYSGDEVGSVDVRVSAQGDGNAWGNAQVEPGRSVTVRAEAVGESAFEGWYEGGELVSEDADYSFAALESRSLVAVFGQPDSDGGEGGSSDGESGGGSPDGGDEGGSSGGDGSDGSPDGGEGGVSGGSSGGDDSGLAGDGSDGLAADSGEGDADGYGAGPDREGSDGSSEPGDSPSPAVVAATGDKHAPLVGALGGFAMLAAGAIIAARRRLG